MVQPAADFGRPGAAALLKLLAPYPGRAAMAWRVALICALTALVTSAYGTPEAAISAYAVFFLNRPDRLTSALLSVAMLLLVTVLLGLVLIVAICVLDDPVWRVASIALLSIGLLFVTSASKLRPVGAIVAMIVGFALDKLGSVPFGEVATRALLYVWLMVAIPIGIAICVNLILAPSPRRLACRELAKRLRLAARSLNDPNAARDGLAACLRQGDAQIGTWLKLSVVEGSSVRADAGALKQAVSSTLAILVAADLAAHEPSGRLPAAFSAPIIETLEEMADMLDAGGYPVDIELDLPADSNLTPLMRIAVASLRDAIVGFAAVESEAAPAQSPPRRGGFFLPDAFTNPDHIRYAFKTTVAAMFCYLLYSQLDWPGIHTCFITVYMVSLGTTAETVEKLTLRIAGCLIGALLGTAAIVYVMPGLTSVGELMGVVLIGAWLSAWVAFGSPRISYAGFQIAFAFFLCVIQGAAPGFDLTLARDRTIGILLGNVVVYLVFTRVWPVSIAVRIDATLAALQQQWMRLTALGQTTTRRAQAASAMAQYGALAQDLALAHYEPSWVRPAPQWIAERQRTLAELGALEGPMFLLAERSTGDAAIGAWLRRLTGAASPEPTEVGQTIRPNPDRKDATTDALTAAVRVALINLGNARLIKLKHGSSGGATKEQNTHEPT
ncbi:FUSC family protein [Paraherbaspirillum soli]|uniref:FUSC family protein n=1 Tax=Paraherbaspirillum soli TaxID=631222 RepID=A0ABW0M649_9BURK